MAKKAKRLARFVRHYWEFCAAAAAAIAGLALQLLGVTTAAHWILGATTLLLAIPMVVGMIQDLRMGTYGVDILAITAIVTAVLMHQYWAAMVIVLMLTGGEALEDFAENRAKREMSALLHNAPRHAHVIRGQKEFDVPAKEVKHGDKLVIRPGEVVPVDAVILEGYANVDEASLTGESVPEEKGVGAELLSGSINLDGTITAKALRSAAESQYEQIVKLVRQAAASKAPFVRMADRFAIPFTLISFVIAGGAWIISGESLRFLQVMVVATPCPLILAAPIAIISGMSRSSKAGIIVKNGTALERVAGARSFAFDKTGTLTHGKLTVASVETYGDATEKEVMAAAAALEKGSNHIVAKAIMNHATALGVKSLKVKNIREVSGKGMVSGEGNHRVLIGRAAFLEENGVSMPKQALGAGKKRTSTFVALGGELAGVIFFEDELRTESEATVAYLRSAGVEDTYLITGDNKATALVIAKAVGIPEKDVVAQALPIDKLKTVERVAKPPVVFVGDGVNDAPVLVAADVGIALGAKGSTAASESADIVIMKDDFSKVADVHRIARRTFKIARQSILVGIGLSVVLMLVFATGKFAPVIGAAVQELVDVVVIFNALRAHLPDKLHA
jgi:heavy metal translocating P-type ATPase